MGVRIKEILKTDSLAGSRIVINNNFKNIKADIAEIDDFFIFDEETGERIGLKSPLLKCDNIEAEKIKNLVNKELIFYKNELPCLKFNENGHVIIRKDSTLNLDLQEELERLATGGIDINGLANQVEETIINDDRFWEIIIRRLTNNSAFIDLIIEKILNNSIFRNKVIEWIERYAPTPTPEECDDFSIYAKMGNLWLHCNKDHDRTNDMRLSDYMPVEGDTLTIKESDIQPFINEYYDGTGDKFKLTYTDEHGSEKAITEDGTYIDYGLDGQGPESEIIAEGVDTSDALYKITKLR